MPKPRYSEMHPAYLAAMIDGEGCMGINNNPNHSLRLSIYNADQNMLQFLQKHIGGTIHLKKKNGHKSTWVLVLSRDTAEKAIKLCFEFLIVKKAQAQLALTFQDRKREAGSGRPLTPEQWEEREWFKEEISRLNQRDFTEEEAKHLSSESVLTPQCPGQMTIDDYDI